MALRSFTDKALFNAYHLLNTFKTLWFKIITNYNRDMKFGYFFHGTPDWARERQLPYGNAAPEQEVSHCMTLQ